MGAQPRTADRDTRRAALPCPRRRAPPRHGEPGFRHRRSRRPHLPGPDAPLRRDRRPAAAPGAPGTAAHPVAVRAVGQPGHPGAAQHRRPAHRVRHPRGGLPRPRHHRRDPGPARRADGLRAGRRPGTGQDSRGRGAHPLVGHRDAACTLGAATHRPELVGRNGLRGRP